VQKIRIKNLIFTIFVVGGVLLVNGCASTYPCGEPDIGKCSSVSENYQHSFSDYTNPDDVAPSGIFDSSSTSKSKPIKMFNFSQYKQTPSDGAPLISQPTMIRVWLTPYTDSDNIYHEQGYEYMLTDKGHWLYGNNSKKINSKIKNISLIQGANSKTNNPDGSFGLPVNPISSATKPTNPNTLLKDYPAFNSLQNQSINKTINPSADTTTIYTP
jgi:conjugal transfer pilus assembly protein TraV